MSEAAPDFDVVQWKPSYISLEGMRVDPQDVVVFLAHLSVAGNVSHACRQSRVSRATVYRMKRELPDMKEAWKHAMAVARDNLEREAHRRAVVGVKRDVLYLGKKVGTKIEYSDALLTTMLRARVPAYAKTAGGTNVTVDQSKTLVVGPPVPDDKSLGTWISRLQEVAEKHLPVVVGCEVEDLQ